MQAQISEEAILSILNLNSVDPDCVAFSRVADIVARLESLKEPFKNDMRFKQERRLMPLQVRQYYEHGIAVAWGSLETSLFAGDEASARVADALLHYLIDYGLMYDDGQVSLRKNGQNK